MTLFQKAIIWLLSICVLFIGYYFVFALPASNQARLDIQQKEIQLKADKQKADKTNYDNCINEAQIQYNIKKDDYCKNVFNNLENSYENCIISKQKERPPTDIGDHVSTADWIRRHPDGSPIQNYNLKQATELCKESYNRSDNNVYNPNCTNMSLDKSLETENDRCMELYK